MKVSFDFDSTLSRESKQKFAKELIKNNFEVWVVTSRFMLGPTGNNINWNKDLFEIAFSLNIPVNHIYFTNGENKVEFFKNNNDFLFHLDDDEDEVRDITNNTKVIGINGWKNNKWKEKCIKIINDFKKGE